MRISESTLELYVAGYIKLVVSRPGRPHGVPELKIDNTDLTHSMTLYEKRIFDAEVRKRTFDMLKMMGLPVTKGIGTITLRDDRDIAMGQYYVDIDKSNGTDKSMRMISQINSDGSMTVLSYEEIK